MNNKDGRAVSAGSFFLLTWAQQTGTNAPAPHTVEKSTMGGTVGHNVEIKSQG